MSEQDLDSAAADRLAAYNARRGELAELMGIELTHVEPALVTGRMPVSGNRQPYGLLHGGANAVLAETLGSFNAVIAAGPGRMAVGVELNCSHHRSARDGFVYGTSTPVHVGRTLAAFQIAITDEDGRAVCTARLTCMILPADSE